LQNVLAEGIAEKDLRYKRALTKPVL